MSVCVIVLVYHITSAIGAATIGALGECALLSIVYKCVCACVYVLVYLITSAIGAATIDALGECALLSIVYKCVCVCVCAGVPHHLCHRGHYHWCYG